MTECDLCGTDTDTEMLGFDRGERDFWRVARVCEPCRVERVMPTLRVLFGDGALNLEPASAGDYWLEEEPDAGDSFLTFRNGRTVHIAKEAGRGPSTGWEVRCRGYCGVKSRADPESRSRALRRPAPALCERCAAAAPERFTTTRGGAEP